MKYGIIVMGDVADLVSVLSQLKDAEAVDVVTTGLKVKPGATVTVVEDEQSNPADDEDPWADSGDKADVTKQYDKFGNQWVLNLPEAPNCECGIPAGQAHMTSKAGKKYTAWRCSKQLGDQWKSKCSYSELVK